MDLNRLRFGSLGMDDRITGLVRLTSSVDRLRIIGRQYADMYGVDGGDFCQKARNGISAVRGEKREPESDQVIASK